MEKLIVEEVNVFRAAVRAQARGTDEQKRSDKYVHLIVEPCQSVYMRHVGSLSPRAKT